MNPQNRKGRVLLSVVSIGGLILVFLFQRFDVGGIIGIESSFWRFIFNRSFRFLLNDALAILLIYALFYERNYVLFAIWVQVIGTVFILLPYFVLKYHYPSYNGPLISFLHRLILNPTLLLMLIPAFYYQKKYRELARTDTPKEKR
jgi:exosortase F-associated protein